MPINGIVQYTSAFLLYISLFTQAPILVWFDGAIIDISTILLTIMCYSGYIMLGYDWWLCTAINISVRSITVGFSPTYILLTQGYYH